MTGRQLSSSLRTWLGERLSACDVVDAPWSFERLETERSVVTFLVVFEAALEGVRAPKTGLDDTCRMWRSKVAEYTI
jgi:hypothetical protein